MSARLFSWVRAIGAAALVLAATLAPPAQQAAQAANSVTYTYSIAVRGFVRSDVNEFAKHAAATLADPRGWSLGGSIRFVPVESGGDFTLWLAEANSLPSFS